MDDIILVTVELNSVFTDRVCSTRREVIFSLCLSVHTWGRYDSQVQRGLPPSNLGWGGTLARSGWGVGVPPAKDGIPLTRSRHGYSGVPPARDGVPPGQGWGIPQLDLGWGTPPSGPEPGPGMGHPPLWTTEGVIATWWSVCLLHSRRRTFLFQKSFGHVFGQLKVGH